MALSSAVVQTEPEREPLFPDVGVLAFAPEWSDVWITWHHVLTRLARYFHVIWVNPAVNWRSMLRKPRKDSRALKYPSMPSGFQLYQHEWWLPTFYRPRFLSGLTSRERLRRAQALLHKRRCKTTIISIWGPEFDYVLDTVPHSLSTYDVIDEYSFSTTEVPTTDREAKLLKRVDHVFVTSKTLLEKKGKLARNVTYLSNGVDYAAYATPSGEPSDMSHLPRPRIGYTGAIKKMLNWQLLHDLARHHPQWCFVFVGPISPHPEIAGTVRDMAALPNVHFLGQKPAWDLPAYTHHFDVCIMPYNDDAYTKYVFPLKLHEYLASGRPVVGTNIPSLQEFADVVSVAGNYEEWVRGITESLEADCSTPAKIAARRNVAKKFDWDGLVRQRAQILSDHLSLSDRERI
jgi:glycosyltransferase involved in cell wall biosynthesis